MSTATHLRNLSTTSVASTISAPSTPRRMNGDDDDGGGYSTALTTRTHSGALMTLQASSPDGSVELVMRALREMMRTNDVRATRQAALNETSAQLHAMNFFLHSINAERSQKLERDYAQVRGSIESGRQLLAHMTTVIASQESALSSLGSAVSTLSTQAEEHGERVAVIEDAMVEQKAQLAQAMQEYEARLAAQEADFRKQEATLARLLSVRFKLDFGLDMLLLLLGFYGSHNALTTTIWNFLGQNVLFRNGGRRMRTRRTRLLVFAAQLISCFLLVRKLRQVAQENGLHHAIGGYTKYARFAATSCGTAVEMVRGGAKSATTLDEDDALAASNDTAKAASSSPSSGVPSDYSSSAASNLGRRVGSLLLCAAASCRDSVRIALGHVVATGAADDDSPSRPPSPRARSPLSPPAHAHAHNAHTTPPVSPPRYAHDEVAAAHTFDGAHPLAPPPLPAMPHPSAPQLDEWSHAHDAHTHEHTTDAAASDHLAR